MSKREAGSSGLTSWAIPAPSWAPAAHLALLVLAAAGWTLCLLQARLPLPARRPLLNASSSTPASLGATQRTNLLDYSTAASGSPGGGPRQQPPSLQPLSPSSSAQGQEGGLRLPPLPLHTTARGRTLVIYVYGGADAEYPANLRFFITEAVKEGDSCDYLIVLQEGEGVVELNPLPSLPRNARYLRHPNACFDWGTVGWVLDSHVPDPAAYHYFIWLNPSVRGPFLPPYLRGHMHWTEPLLSKINTRVKLVGATINCGSSPLAPRGLWQPHVQSYLVATDGAGLHALRNSAGVFGCYQEMHDTIWHSEVGSSRAIMAAGYSIDSLMLRFQGHNDGISVDPLEVLFVKVKSSLRQAGWSAVQAAVKYSEWSQLVDEQAARAAAGLNASAAWLAALARNTFKLDPRQVAEASRRGPTCFDHAFYIASSPDLGFLQQQQPAVAAAWAWDHFLHAGLTEGRPHRFTC